MAKDDRFLSKHTPVLAFSHVRTQLTRKGVMVLLAILKRTEGSMQWLDFPTLPHLTLLFHSPHTHTRTCNTHIFAKNTMRERWRWPPVVVVVGCVLIFSFPKEKPSTVTPFFFDCSLLRFWRRFRSTAVIPATSSPFTFSVFSAAFRDGFSYAFVSVDFVKKNFHHRESIYGQFLRAHTLIHIHPRRDKWAHTHRFLFTYFVLLFFFLTVLGIFHYGISRTFAFQDRLFTTQNCNSKS